MSNEEDQLISDLSHPSAKKKEEAALKLIYLGTPKAVPALLKNLNDTHEKVRLATLQALGELKVPQSVESILNLLKDPNIKVRKTAKRLLPQFGDMVFEPLCAEIEKVYAGERPPLLEILARLDISPEKKSPLGMKYIKSEDSECRRVAVKVLRANLEYSEHLNILLKLLTDPEDSVRQEAIKAFQNNPEPQVIQALLEYLPQEPEKELWLTLGKTLLSFKEKAVSPLISSLLFNHENEIQEFAILILGELNHPQALPHLKQLFESAEFMSVKQACLAALQHLEPESLWDPLSVLFGDPSDAQEQALRDLQGYPISETTWWALFTHLSPHLKSQLILRTAQDFKELLHLLYPLLQDKNPEIRASSITSLSQEDGNQSVISPMIADPNSMVRLRALKAMCELEPQSQLWPQLVLFFQMAPNDVFDILPNKDISLHAPLFLSLFTLPLPPSQKLTLAKTFDRISYTPAAPYLLKSLPEFDAEFKAPLLLHLATLKYTEAKVQFYESLESPHEGLRLAARKSIAQLKLEDINAIQCLFEHPMWFVREEAVTLLSGVSDSPIRSQILKTAISDRDRDVRKAAIFVMGNEESSVFLDPLLNALETGFRDVRIAAAKALKKYPQEDVEESFFEAFEEDDEDDVRYEIALTISGWKTPYEAIGYLEEGLLQDESEKVRQACAKTLGALRVGEPSLIQALQDPEISVSKTALTSLSQLQNQGSISHLSQHLNHGNSDLRATAAACLEGVHQENILQELYALVQEDEYLKVRMAALHSLVAIILPQEIRERIETDLPGWPKPMQLKAFNAFVNDPQALIKHLENPVFSPLVLQAIQGRPLPELSPIIFKQFDHYEAVEDQQRAVDYFAQFADTSHLSYLFQTVVSTPHPKVKERAILALVHQGEAALPFIKELFNIWDTSLHEFLAQASLQIGTLMAPVLAELLNELPPHQVQWIIYALGELKSSTYLGLLTSKASQEPALMEPLFQALKKIGLPAKTWLSEQLKSKERKWRSESARVLHSLESDNGLWNLHIQLNSRLAIERLKALKSQLALTHLPQLKGLEYLLEDEDINVKKYFYQMLYISPVPELKPILEAQLNASSQALTPDLLLANAKVNSKLDLYLPFLSSLNPDIRHNACLALGYIEAWEQLYPLLPNASPKLQLTLLNILSQSNAPEVPPLILDLLNTTRSQSVQLQCIRALGLLQAQEALPYFKDQLLTHASYDHQRFALDALGNFDLNDCGDALLAFLDSSDSIWMDMNVQIQVISLLGKSTTEAPLGSLIKLFHEPTWKDSRIKLAALKAILNISPDKGRGFLYQAKEDEEYPSIQSFAEKKLEEIYSTSP